MDNRPARWGLMPRKADSTQSVKAALDAIMLDVSWQIGMTDEQRWQLVEWAKRVLSGSFEAALLSTRMKLAEIHGLPESEQADAINALVSSPG